MSFFFLTIQCTGRRIIGAPDEKAMDEIMLDIFSYSVGVIFNDSFSYKFKFYHRYYVPILKEDFFTGDFPYKVLLLHCYVFNASTRMGRAAGVLAPAPD